MSAWLLLAALATAPDAAPLEPDPATLIYYNARLALRENKPTEVIKLWMLRNMLMSERGELSEYDDEFVSVMWVALGRLGYCQDDLRLDTRAAGLWPLALHNWFLVNRSQQFPDKPSPFDAFEVGRQARRISLIDVLSVEELKTARFLRTWCGRIDDVLIESGGSSSDEPREPAVGLRVLAGLLQTALATLSKDRIRGRSVVEARLLDVHLAQVKQREREFRREAQKARRRGRALSVDMGPPPEELKSQRMAQLIKVASRWTPDEWLALEPQRRLFIYERFRPSQSTGRQLALMLSMIDGLIARRRGEELEDWIGYLGRRKEFQRVIWSGERGRDLLALEPKTGFRERSAIALHRGVSFLQAGARADALRSFAYALHYAPDSKASVDVEKLALRWMSYVARQYAVNNELLTTLVALVPRGALSQILQDLVWDAAFNGDQESFERVALAYRGRGALRRSIARIRPLSESDTGTFLTELRAELADAPYSALRFLNEFVERLLTQDGDVRVQYRSTLRRIRTLLDSQPERRRGSLARRAAQLDERIASVLDGIDFDPSQDDAKDRARAMSPTAEVFAGRIRLAPSDPLPWPFKAPPPPPAPSVFSPIRLTPIEWRIDGELVHGWKVGQ